MPNSTSDYVGMTVRDAEIHALKNRKVIRVFDEKNQVGTLEYRNDRVNLQVRQGKVVSASIG